MYPTLFFSAFMLASCLTKPANDAAQPGLSAATKAPTNAAGDPFPVPKEGLTIKVGAEGDSRLESLLNDFSRVSGQALLITKEVRQQLQNTSTGLNRSIDVPAQEVYPVVEAILAQNDFILSLRSDREPRLLAVESLNSNRRASLRADAVFISADQVPAWSRHPAFLVTTVIDLPNTDVRTLSNSMRTLFTDQSTQQIIPVGNSNSLVITANGSSLSSLVSMLRATDEVARREAEQRKANPPRPAPRDGQAKDAPAAEATGKDAPPK